MPKVVLNNLVSLQNEQSAVLSINTNNELISQAIENTLSRDGTAPNEMGSTLDMNNNRIINLPGPQNPTEPLRMADLDAFIDTGAGVLPGGLDDQVLRKASATSFDTEWHTLTKGDVGLGNVDNTTDLNKPVSTATQTALNDKISGLVSSVDNTAVRFDSTTGKVIQGSPLVIADTTGALSRNGGGGVPLQGTNTNDAAAAGDVGQHVSQAVVSGSAVALTSTSTTNIASISLGAGDWDVWVNARFTGAAGTTVTNLAASITTTSATLDTSPGRIASTFHNGQSPFAATDLDINVGATRFSLATTTTVYFVVRPVFATSTCSGYGIIQARRRR